MISALLVFVPSVTHCRYWTRGFEVNMEKSLGMTKQDRISSRFSVALMSS